MMTVRISTGGKHPRRGLASARKTVPDLPGEIRLIMFSFMQYANFWHARLVSKTWKTSWDIYWDELTTQDFRQQLPLWLFECKLQIPPCGRFMRFVHAHRHAYEQNWTVRTWIEQLDTRLRMLDAWNNRLMTRMTSSLMSSSISLQMRVHLRMISSLRTSETVPWIKYYDKNAHFMKMIFDTLWQKKGEIEKRRIEVLNEEQMPWFYNDAIPPIALLARAKPFPSLYPINPRRPFSMPSWM